MEKKRSQIILFVLCAAAMLPMMIWRDATVSNELRYLSIVDEALRDGHLFAFYNHGAEYADKPPLFFWLMMLGKSVFGRHSMLYLSSLSLIPAFVTAAVLDRWCAPAMRPSMRLAASAALLTTLYFAASAAVVRMDMLMTMFITLALYAFYRMYEGDGRLGLRIAFPLYVFLAIFSKGAVGLLVPLLCIPVFLLLKGRLRTLGRYWGWLTWAVLAVLCGIWFYMAYCEGGESYLRNLLFHQTVDRAVNAFYHKAPFYQYLLHFWYIMFPWCILVAGTIAIAFIRRQKTDDRATFMACSAAVIMIMLSCVSSKLDIYFLPAIGLAIYATFMLLPGLKADRFVKFSLLLPFAAIVIGIPAAFLVLKHSGSMPSFAANVGLWAAIPLEAGAAAALAAVFKGRMKTVTCSFAAGLYLTVMLFGLQIKQINPHIGYRSLCEEAMAVAAEKDIGRYVLATGPDGAPLLERGENIDAYLGVPVEMIPEDVLDARDGSISGDGHGMIVFTMKDKKPTFAVYGNE